MTRCHLMAMAVLVPLLGLAWLPAHSTGQERAKPDVVALAAEIDRLVGAKLKASDVSPAPLADDAAFFRRANLVLAGRIPVPSEARAYLSDARPDKKARAVDRMLASSGHIQHMTTSWRNWLLPEAATDANLANSAPLFENWLRVRIRGKTPFDVLVRDLLTYPLDGRAVAGQDPTAEESAQGPLAFYLAKEGKPENLAAATARVFMGVHLECAQCHDHPFAKWSRNQFWGMAAFFAGVERPSGGGIREMPGRRELLIPNSDRAVPITFLDDREPEWQYKKSPRVTLANWLTAPSNPFFARAISNRLWGVAFGLGLVEPIDDFHDQNKPSHPELLDTLAKAFVDSGFDCDFLMRAICLSDTFARSSAVADPQRQPARLFANYPLQGLSAEQLYESLALVLGQRAEGMDSPRRQFLETFGVTGARNEAPTTILQALFLMNGQAIGQATQGDAGRLLGGLLHLQGLTPAERVEAIYLATLSRFPRPNELRRALDHIESGSADQSKTRYADILWALLNGVEFRTNH